MKYRAAIILIGIALMQSLMLEAPAAQKANPGDPASSAARSFFRFHFAHDKGFTLRNVRQRKPWLTTELYKLLLDELKREAEESKAHPDEAPYFEGDPFTDSQESPDSFRVGKSDVNGDRAKVPVTLLWSAHTSRGRDKRDIIIELSRTGNGWLISDVLNSDGKSLRDELKR